MRKNVSYFTPTPKTLEELKKLYRKLVFTYHPDKGGDAEAMKAINSEYDELFKVLKDIHQTKDGETYTAREATTETADQFKDLINELMKMDAVEIEIIGCFVWVTGNTKQYKDKLKELKFQWHRKKSAWFLKPENYRCKSRRNYDFDEIRQMYGTSGKSQSRGLDKLEDTSA